MRKVRNNWSRDVGRVSRALYGAARRRYRTMKEYEKYYDKLAEYGQAPAEKKAFGNSKDLAYVRTKWNRIKEYVNIYKRYRRSVERFNEKYDMHATMPEMDKRMTIRTTQNLIREYEEWKKRRRNWVRSLGDEYVEEMKTLIDYVKYCITGIKSDMIKNPKDIRIKEHLVRATTLLNALKYWKKHRKDGYEKAKRIKANWDELMTSIQIWIFNDSDGDARREAWLLVESTITGEEVTGDWTDFEEIV